MNAEGRRISESRVRENRMHGLMQGEVKIFHFPTLQNQGYFNGAYLIFDLN